MTTRTSKKTVTFRRPFVLGGFDEVLPAGAYSVETDEELLEGISFPAYRRVLTVIHLQAKSGRHGYRSNDAEKDKGIAPGRSRPPSHRTRRRRRDDGSSRTNNCAAARARDCVVSVRPVSAKLKTPSMTLSVHKRGHSNAI
jgi:hypothetical protein